MNLERNKRIAAFRKVSGYLLLASRPLLILLCLGGLMAVIGVLFVQAGSFDIHQSILKLMDDPGNFGNLKTEGLTLGSKIFFALSLAAIFIPMFYMFLHLQKLIECFYDGDIFNARALFHARAAYKINLYMNIAWIILTFGTLIYCFQFADDNLKRSLNWLWSSIVLLIEIGVLSLILWALEIGTDLNEEAELTI
jgi:hypothetical protein